MHTERIICWYHILYALKKRNTTVPWPGEITNAEIRYIKENGRGIERETSLVLDTAGQEKVSYER